MESDVLSVEIEQGVASLVLNRPEKINALGRAFFTELPRVLADLEDSAEVRVIVISGSGPNFCAGLDLKEFAGAGLPSTTAEIAILQRGFLHLSRLQKPTIAAVSGHCIGAGLDLVAACDIRYADSSAVLSLREVTLGMVADLGSLSFLSQVLTKGTLAELALTGRNVSAAQAHEIGLVDRIFETQAELANGVRELADSIVANPVSAVRATKSLLSLSRDLPPEDALRAAAQWNLALFSEESFSRNMLTVLASLHTSSESEEQPKLDQTLGDS